MSATNRGSTRKPHDFYPTPIPTIETFLDVFPLRGGIEVLEPGAGSGNIIKTLQKYGDFSIDAVEIRPEEAQHLQDLGVNVIIDDFLSMDLGKKYDLIIGNPPFNQAIEFVEKCLGLLKPGGKDKKILIVSGERRGESSGRSKYNEMEIHRSNATAKAHRLVHQWRAVIDYSERDVWEVIKRNQTTPHPCYSAGWNRCSCMMCIFSLPRHWAGIRELFPEEFEAVKNDEERLGFTLDNKKDLEEYVGDAESCVCHAAVEAIRQIISGKFTVDEITTPSELWDFPAGAFKGSDGGPC